MICGWRSLGFVGAGGDGVVGGPRGFDGLKEGFSGLVVLIPVKIGFGDADDAGLEGGGACEEGCEIKLSVGYSVAVLVEKADGVGWAWGFWWVVDGAMNAGWGVV